jgi:hypothetical protein
MQSKILVAFGGSVSRRRRKTLRIIGVQLTHDNRRVNVGEIGDVCGYAVFSPIKWKESHANTSLKPISADRFNGISSRLCQCSMRYLTFQQQPDNPSASEKSEWTDMK